MTEKRDKKRKDVEPVHETPSGRALAEVGPPPEDATDEELVAHHERYTAAKLKARRGS